MTKNIWSKFKSNRIVDGKPRNVIVDICGDIINRSPSKEELKGLKRHLSVKDILKLPEEEKKKYLLEFLRYFYNKEGRSPRESDFNNNPKYPSRATYWRIFGSWNNAIEVAGLEPKIAGGQSYTNEELLRYLIQFYEENGRSPTMEDFRNNYKYPGFSVYQKRFGSWQNALKLVGLDLDSMVRRGIIETSDQKARLAEILVIKHFSENDKVIDLSGQNCNNPYDGICPKGEPYDVKSSSLNGNYWIFDLDNVHKDEIEWYYLLVFNKDYSKLQYAWRIPAWDFMESIEKGYIHVGTDSDYTYNLENMEQYLITKEIMPIFENWLDKIEKQDNSKEAIIQNARSMLQKYNRKLYDGYIE